MNNGVKEVALIDADAPPAALTTSNGNPPMLPMIERLAAMPEFDVAKLEKLLDMQERIMDRHAEQAFNVAFTAMQAALPTVVERGRTDKTAYAKLEDIIDTTRPILREHGFSLSFRTEWPEKSMVKVVGILTHQDGHSRQSEFLSAADASGSKNAIQALGSAVSYGRRYTTLDLLNITTRTADDDGWRATPPKEGGPATPKGFEDWLIDLQATADTGYPALEKAWKKSKPEFRDHLKAIDPREVERLKDRARKVVQA